MKKMRLLPSAVLAANLLLVAVLSSCGNGKKTSKIIIAKSHHTFMNNALQPGICRFFYREYERGEAQEFEDSCYKYNVGDTIIGRSVNSH